MTGQQEQNLIRRINRVLMKDGQKLRKSRGEGQKTELGDYYVIDGYRNTLVTSRIYDLEKYAEKLLTSASK